MKKLATLTARLSMLALALAAAAPLAAAEEAPRPAKASKPPALSEEEMMQRLRERLAEKLGAPKAGEKPNPHVMRVVARGGADEPAPPKPPRPTPKAEKAEKAAKAAEPASPNKLHWSYAGEAGPKAWGGLKPEFAKCANGTRQSPIDIRGGIAVDLEPVVFDYKASPFRVIDNGHTVQVNIDGGNAIVLGGRRFELAQFHFHRPAEERIDGRSFEMGLHLVHKDAEGRLAVVALLLDRGAPQPVVQAVWNNLPLEKHDEVSTRAVLDLNHLLPPDRGYYTYMGSLTTPPCNEGVQWVVMRQPVAVSAEQIEIFARLYPMNARPVQQAAGRMIKQSN